MLALRAGKKEQKYALSLSLGPGNVQHLQVYFNTLRARRLG